MGMERILVAKGFVSAEIYKRDLELRHIAGPGPRLGMGGKAV
jgi:hypothetical protein